MFPYVTTNSSKRAIPQLLIITRISVSLIKILQLPNILLSNVPARVKVIPRVVTLYSPHAKITRVQLHIIPAFAISRSKKKRKTIYHPANHAPLDSLLNIASLTVRTARKIKIKSHHAEDTFSPVQARGVTATHDRFAVALSLRHGCDDDGAGVGDQMENDDPTTTRERKRARRKEARGGARRWARGFGSAVTVPLMSIRASWGWRWHIPSAR